MLATIIWNMNPDIFTIGTFTLRWYGILFAMGLFLGGYYGWKQFKKNNLSQDLFEGLLIYLFIGIFLGARLGHCLFYEPGYYLHHIIEIFLPITITKSGAIQIVGYQGLASHGGGVGLLTALAIYRYKHPFSILKVGDIIGIATPLTGFFIRLGNLMNSEIVGIPSSSPLAFVFTAIDNVPRHPTQLYEAFYYLAVFLLCAWLYAKGFKKDKPGFYLGLVIILIMVFRFFIEFLKMPQVDFESSMTFNMGQYLSIPYLLVGFYLMFRPTHHKHITTE